MIKVKVQNFQSIKEATVEIDGFTVITGTNNSGKTALQRAIRGVFTTTPGSAFVRHGEEFCSVEVAFEDGTSVVWEKGEKIKPRYFINGHGPIHSGRGVPKELDAFGISPLKVSNRELWPQIAPQFTGQIFLIDLPPSVMAEVVADIDRVGDLNAALRASEKERRGVESTLKVRAGDRLTLESDLEQYEGLEEAVSEFSSLEDRHRELSEMLVSHNELCEFRCQIQTQSKVVQDLIPVETIEIPLVEHIKPLLVEIRDLQDLEKQIKEEREIISSLSEINGIQISEVPAPSQEELKEVISLEGRYQTALKEVSGIEGDITSVEQRLEEMSSLILDCLEEHGECPVCGQDV